MTTADLSPGVLDVTGVRQGEPITLVCTFNIDLTGYTDWVASVQPVDLGVAHSFLFAIDITQQASGIITLKLAGSATAQFLKARWDLVVNDPNGDPFYVLAGDILCRPPAVETV